MKMIYFIRSGWDSHARFRAIATCPTNANVESQLLYCTTTKPPNRISRQHTRQKSKAHAVVRQADWMRPDHFTTGAGRNGRAAIVMLSVFASSEPGLEAFHLLLAFTDYAEELYGRSGILGHRS